MKKYILLVLFSLSAFSMNGAWALTASTQSSVSNSILFIENDVDSEYFITPSSLSPRISGSNKWVKYGSSQDSLGYMGITSWTSSTSYYKDMWIDNSPMSEPFRGIRCNSGSNCPSSGYIAAEQTDQYGFYHTKSTGSGTTGGYYAFASLTDSAYEYFRTMNVGTTETYNLNFCYTSVDFDYASGARCKDQSSGNWYIRAFSLTKLGHLRLESTNALQEIWVASDGTPSITGDTGYCELGTVSNVDGIICKMIKYSLNQTGNLTSSLTMQMYADSSVLGFSPSSSSIKYSGDGSSWTNYGTSSKYYNIFSTGGEYVYVFLSKSFLKSLVDNGVTISDANPFTFAFTNSVTPESGYYQFTPSLQLNITPKEYGISIRSSNNTSSANGSGTIGNEDPIEMDYTITVSGPRQADSITAQVIGDSTTIDDVYYCVFTSTDGDITVPIPAYLQFNNQSGGVTQERNSCGEDAIALDSALWEETPWDENSTDDGSYYTTSLKLLFAMDDSRSTLSVSGLDWEGVVSASGTIEVTANWVGVTK